MKSGGGRKVAGTWEKLGGRNAKNILSMYDILKGLMKYYILKLIIMITRYQTHES